MRRNLYALSVLCLVLAACASGDAGEDDTLPTRFVLPTLALEVTDEVYIPAEAEATPSQEAAVVVTETPLTPTIDPASLPPELATDSGATPEPSPTPPGAEVTEPPPVAGASGETTVQDFSGLQPGDVVSLAGTLVIDAAEQQVLLQDIQSNRVYLNMPFDRVADQNNAFVTVSGVIEAVEGTDLLALVITADVPIAVEQTAEVDPQAVLLAEQRRVLEETVAADMTALQAYDALLPLVEAEISGYEPATIYGTPITRWYIEFYDEANGDTVLYTVGNDGTIEVDFTARSTLSPEIPISTFARDQVQVDSNAVYDQLDLSDVPDFAIPEIRLQVRGDGALEWLVQSTPPVTIDAGLQP